MKLQDLILKAIDKIYSQIPQEKPSRSLLLESKIIAHRGEHIHHKENTLKAFQSCVDHKIFGIEFDIQFTKDLIPLVFHDRSAERVFHRRNIIPQQMTLAEIKKNLPEIPTLKEVLDTFKNKIHFMIELKKPLNSNLPLNTIQNSLEHHLRDLTPGVDFHIISLNPETFDFVPFIDPQFLGAIAETNTSQILNECLKRKCGFFMSHYLVLTDSIIHKLKYNGIKWSTGFIDSKNLAYREINRGCEFLFSNNPIILKSSLMP